MIGATLILSTFMQFSLAYHLKFFVPLNYEDLSLGDCESGKGFAHALTIAVDDVNNDPKILPGHRLTYSWIDSTNNNVVSQAMQEIQGLPQNESVDVFIGPAFNCSTPAKVAEALDIPMISYLCAESGYFTKQEFPLFIQTYQNTNTQAASALFALLEKQGWRRIGIIYEEGNEYWTNLKSTMLTRTNIDIVTSMQVPKVNKFDQYGEYFLEFPRLKQRNMSLAKVNDILTYMAHEKQVEVFVLLTSFDVLIEIMAEAYDLGLAGFKPDLNERPRVFIGFQPDAKIRRKNYVQYPEIFFSPYAEPVLDVMFRAKKGARSLLIISAEDPVNNARYERFRNLLVKKTENDGPFKDEAIFDPLTGETEISEIACALYDAVYQYALSLHRLLERNATVTSNNVVEEFRSHSYEGMSGYTSKFSERRGVLNAHLSLLHMEEDVNKKNFRKTHVKTVGTFYYNQNSEIKLSLSYNNLKKSLASALLFISKGKMCELLWN
ncbi:receptor-type guanylate cyclase Gyc76C-like [Dendronephthya gigantea]|uniref:receptor-type guanylate cyclase Gyc76C-like n=1 Tax=Dendronephthya gigantea TaxID=151771 RepID=UPI0010694626|nr:receptor-type guanylate cyclase Gyc76C-like [Dendronephthya gigantea]